MELVDIVEQIEECAKLIIQDNPNKDILALIMIDSVYDMFVIDYFNNTENDLNNSLEFYSNFKNLQSSIETTTGLSDTANKYWTEAKQKYDDFLSCKQHYENRLNYLFRNNHISQEECETVKALHKFRNIFLHQSARKNLYLKPLVLLYYKLLTNIFIKISETSYSSRDYKCKYLTSSEKLSKNRQENIILLLNKEYNLNFDIKEIKNLLKDFLLKEIEFLEENVYFILDCLEDKEYAINRLSNEFNLNKCLVFEYDGKQIIDVRFEKIKRLTNKANNLTSFKNFDKLINSFSNTFTEITTLFNPIYKEACLIDQYIELQAEILRGK